MKVIFVNRFFYPDCSATSQMLSDLAFELAKRNHEIHVITSQLLYNGNGRKLPPLDVTRGVRIHRVYSTAFGQRGLGGRMLDYLSFFIFCLFKLVRLASRGDVVVIKTDPPLLSILAAPVMRLKRVKVINWLQDIFPEVAERMIRQGRLARILFNFMRWARNWSLDLAEMNVVPGALMADHLRKEGVPEDKIHVVANWSDGELVYPVSRDNNDLLDSWGLKGKFIVGYSGNLGRAHDVDTIIEAAQIIALETKKNPSARDIVFLIIGGGAQRRRLLQEMHRRRLPNIYCKPYQTREKLAQSVSVADIHLISLNPDLEGLIVPSKFYGVAAAGRMAFFIGDSNGEIAQILQNHQIGHTIAPGDGAQLASHILSHQSNLSQTDAMGANARKVFDIYFDKKISLQKWDVLLTNMKLAGGLGDEG